MKLDPEVLKNEFIAELKAGKYDADILPNEEIDYQTVQKEEFEAFKEYLNSNDAKEFCAEILRK